VAGAFLKEFTFPEIQRALKEHGISAPTRIVVVLPPLNVYRHLSAMSLELAATESQIYDYALMRVKPVYGLNDAPLAWQLCLHSFIKTTGGERSHLDENTFSWKENQRLVAMAKTHVDDIALAASSKWMDEMYKGKVTRQQLPFTHCGCEYEKVENGYKIHQQDFAKKLKPARVPQRGDEEKLDKDEITELRAILGGLLWLTATRLDINADLSLLQSRVTIIDQEPSVGQGACLPGHWPLLLLHEDSATTPHVHP